MAARASYDWLFRDIRLTYVVLVWIAFGSSLLFYFSDWPQFRREAAVKPQSHNAESVTKDTNDKLYVGSIIIVSERGDRCLELRLDNRSGKMWDMGFVNCDEAITPVEKNEPRGGISVLRMDAISKAFKNSRN